MANLASLNIRFTIPHTHKNEVCCFPDNTKEQEICREKYRDYKNRREEFKQGGHHCGKQGNKHVISDPTLNDISLSCCSYKEN